MDLVVYDDDEKRYVPWAVALTAALLVALLTAAATFLVARQTSGSEDRALGGVSAPEPATAPSGAAGASPSTAAGPTPPPECLDALLRADAALQRSLAVEQALTDHTRIADELLAARITAEQALDRTLPVLTRGATERKRLDEAVAAYQDARRECPA